MKTNDISYMRIGALMIGMTFMFAILIIKLYMLQVINASAIIASSERSRSYYKILPSTRGLILDRNNRTLVQNTMTYTVTAGSDLIEDVTQTLTRAGSILQIPLPEIQRHIAALQKEKVEWREIERSASEEEKEKLEAANLPGIVIQPHPTRIYPEGSLASHVIGFTGTDNEGLAGIELSLNDKMQGTAQPIVTDKDIRRRMIAEEDYTKILTRGVDYVLTLDSYIQYVVERELKRVCEETNALQANAVIIQPKTGDILAMANYPTFDPNHYGDFSAEERKNRLLVDVFEPGSIIKPFIMCAALDQQAVTPETPFYCENGSYYYRGHTIHDDIHRFGTMTAHDILVRSSNIGMVKIIQTLGQSPDDVKGQAQVLYDYLSRFGFKNTGAKTTEELPGESAGKLPVPNKWWPSTIPFGQGITTNTLILAGAYSSIANRGMYVKPRILLGKRSPEGIIQPFQPEPSKSILSNNVAEEVVQMMVDVTENPEGTGRKIRIPGFHIAGKTGTAQKVNPEIGTYGRGMRIASFAGFFPAENPQAVIVVVVDEPKNKKYGGEVSGPVFKKIAEELIAYWGLSPTYKDDPLFIAAMNENSNQKSKDKTPAQPSQNPFGVTGKMPIDSTPQTSASQGKMPNLLGLPIREAYIQLAMNGLCARFEGSGKVVNQPLAAGTSLNDSTDIGIIQCKPILTDPEIQTGAEWVVQR